VFNVDETGIVVVQFRVQTILEMRSSKHVCRWKFHSSIIDFCTKNMSVMLKNGAPIWSFVDIFVTGFSPTSWRSGFLFYDESETLINRPCRPIANTRWTPQTLPESRSDWVSATEFCADIVFTANTRTQPEDKTFTRPLKTHYSESVRIKWLQQKKYQLACCQLLYSN
jgi:hypothetical protein